MSYLSQIDIAEAIKIIQSKAPNLKSETVDLLEATQRTLASDLKSKVDHPTNNDSAIDGFACKAIDTLNASKDNPTKLKIVGEVAAGSLYTKPINSGEAVHIYTGAIVPEGCDAVIRVEDTKTEAGYVYLSTPASSKDIRKKAQDFSVGQTLLKAGTVLDAASIALAVAMGHKTVEVSTKPRIGILATGDEVIEPGQELEPGQVYNSNSYALKTMVEAAGGQAVMLNKANDNLEILANTIKQAGQIDLLLTTGGVSMGKFDFVRDLLFEHGQVEFWKIAERPGGPVLFGSWQNIPILGIPGNPVSAMVVFLLHAKPFIIKALGSSEIIPFKNRKKAVSKSALPGAGFKTNFVRVKLKNNDSELSLTGSQSSGVLHSMFLADALAIVPPNTKISDGDIVEYIPLNSYL